MNNERREKLVIAMLLIECAQGLLSQARDDEQSAFDALPESLQCSSRGEEMEEAVSSIDSAADETESVMGTILAAIMQRFDGLASNFRNFRRPCARIGAVDPLLGRCGDFSNGVWG